ncbi:MAG: DUF4097 domain-containing protein [Clostridiales bacterium]|jgi:hypothetical protein|nr:DUF4097 domain-containing protein [Clostridiales bacterium]
MKTAAIIRIVLFSIIALVLLALLVAGIGGNILFRRYWPDISFGGVNFSVDGFQYPNAAAYQSGVGSVDADEINDIDVNWMDGDITVVTADTDMITFSETSDRALSDKMKMRHYIENGKLYIRFCEAGLRNWPFGFNKHLTLTVPKGSAYDVMQIESVSGAVAVDGVQAENFDLTTVSGRTALTNMRCEQMNINTVSGGFEARDITADTLDFEGVSGGVEIADCRLRDVKVSVVSGTVLIQPGEVFEDMDVESVSGIIRVRLPENDGFTARYSELNMNIRCDFAVQTQNRHMVYKDGGATLNFDTVSGSVHIEKE